MRNNKKKDDISVNNITSHSDIKASTEIKAVTQQPTGNAAVDPFCVYDHKRHAVGSKIKNDDGSEYECNEEGSWKNTSGSSPKNGNP